MKTKILSILLGLLIATPVLAQSSSLWKLTNGMTLTPVVSNWTLNIASTTGTSTASNGWNISGGCYAIAGTCIGAGSVSSVNAGVDTLTFSPTTGAVLGNVNLNSSNFVWSQPHTWGVDKKINLGPVSAFNGALYYDSSPTPDAVRFGVYNMSGVKNDAPNIFIEGANGAPTGIEARSGTKITLNPGAAANAGTNGYVSINNLTPLSFTASQGLLVGDYGEFQSGLALPSQNGGILKTDGDGIVSVATPGTDYLTTAITSLGALNQGQTGATQTLATSTTGTDFTITSSGNTHTFNIPSASTAVRGLVSAVNQTFDGIKTFIDGIVVSGGNLTINNDIHQYFGTGQVVDAYYESGTSKMHIEQLSPGNDLIFGFDQINFGSGVVLGGNVVVPTGQDGNYNIGTSVERIGTVFATALSDGASSVGPGNIVTTNGAQTITNTKTIGTANRIGFRLATAQYIRSPNTNLLDIVAGTTIALSTGGTATTTLSTTSLTTPSTVSIGAGTSTPMGKISSLLNVGETLPYGFIVASSTATASTTLFGVTRSGHLIASSTVPTLSSCGTSPSVSGGNSAGTVTVGSVSANGCTITFANPWVSAPHCVVTNRSMSLVNAMSYTVSTTAITVTQTGLTGSLLDYICLGES